MTDAERIILKVLANTRRRVPATKLVKLVYLVDYIHFQHFGETATGMEYQWDHYGPNAVGHEIVRVAEKLAQEGPVIYDRNHNSFGNVTKLFKYRPDAPVPTLSPAVEMIVDDVVLRYGKLSAKSITAVSKRTRPFKKASQYDMLVMEHSLPAMTLTTEDVEAYRRDLREHGTLPLEALMSEYGMQ